MNEHESSTLKKNRIFTVLIGIVLVLIGWNVRLFWIQVASATHLTDRGIDLVENSVVQREQGIVLDSGRGDFVDRNGVSLTGKTMRVLTAFPIETDPSGAAEREASLARAAKVLGVPDRQLTVFLDSLTAPQIWTVDGRAAALTEDQAQRLDALGLPDLRVTTYKERYDRRQPAAQVIGYIGQNPERITKQFTDQFHKGELQLTSKIGNAGLEKTFEPWLRGIGATSVSLFTDAARRPLPGLDIRTVTPGNPYYPLKIVTTLDRKLQERIEGKLEQWAIRDGAVVVMDIENADVIAMASRPSFQPEHVDMANEAGWGNRALKAETPGSIFKTVTAAAAMDEHVVKPGETFHCDGELGKFGFTCWKKEGHGTLTLEEGFAQSCNIVFAEVAQRLGGERLERYAQSLGLTNRVGWLGDTSAAAGFRQLDGEEAGQVYAASTDRKDAGALVQTAIGQRDVLLTPLQAANLVVTLFHGGQVLSPRVVQEVRFRNERLYERFDSRHAADAEAFPSIHQATAKTMLGWMTQVVDHGTGSALQAAKWPVAGKSGTAQVQLAGGKPGENHWFIGYGPADHPKYAVAVLIRHVPAGTKNKSILLFQEAMDILAEADQ
ncbi:peptidoglycan D,D-transpeptidase FtsI family protein [Paenibacillus sp.]|uniref:peptidoglycan D,D-transpeptidase FtsI family protein n=1 Tax=Paenibacillus sp. TaxID=58172 RepID=UPI0035619FC3